MKEAETNLLKVTPEEDEVLPDNTKQYEGKIIKVSSDGWGFITSKDIPYEKIFFHWTGLNINTIRFPELKNRMKVKFNGFQVQVINEETNKPENRWRAVNITVIE
jgi:hypothetical protein